MVGSLARNSRRGIRSICSRDTHGRIAGGYLSILQGDRPYHGEERERSVREGHNASNADGEEDMIVMKNIITITTLQQATNFHKKHEALQNNID